MKQGTKPHSEYDPNSLKHTHVNGKDKHIHVRTYRKKTRKNAPEYQQYYLCMLGL